jgi:carbamoyl-phosphate synthase small subunit
MTKKALLVLNDGIVFEGTAFGASGETIGEVVFNTSMTGYQEILTDPSYKGQIVTMTYTQIGNYGVNAEDTESSDGIKAEGFVVKEAFTYPSNWRNQISLPEYLLREGIVGIEGIDTRALTKHLRNHGAQMGIISSEDLNPRSLLEKVRAHPGINGIDLVPQVTVSQSYTWDKKVWSWSPPISHIEKESHSQNIHNDDFPHLIVYDFGVKHNILRNLVTAGFRITVVPGQTPAEEILTMDSDGVFLSNGPGDPSAVTYAIDNVKKIIGKKPILGICLGHQILGLALGGHVYKLKFGHHGGNHPVMDLLTKKVEITAQNHNYCVDFKSLGDQVKLTHKNLYDGTEEGMEHRELPLFSVQYHPEASPGPHDSTYIFHRFKEDNINNWFRTYYYWSGL